MCHCRIFEDEEQHLLLETELTLYIAKNCQNLTRLNLVTKCDNSINISEIIRNNKSLIELRLETFNISNICVSEIWKNLKHIEELVITNSLTQNTTMEKISQHCKHLRILKFNGKQPKLTFDRMNRIVQDNQGMHIISILPQQILYEKYPHLVFNNLADV